MKKCIRHSLDSNQTITQIAPFSVHTRKIWLLKPFWDSCVDSNPIWKSRRKFVLKCKQKAYPVWFPYCYETYPLCCKHDINCLLREGFCDLLIMIDILSFDIVHFWQCIVIVNAIIFSSNFMYILSVAV